MLVINHQRGTGFTVLNNLVGVDYELYEGYGAKRVIEDRGYPIIAVVNGNGKNRILGRYKTPKELNDAMKQLVKFISKGMVGDVFDMPPSESTYYEYSGCKYDAKKEEAA